MSEELNQAPESETPAPQTVDTTSMFSGEAASSDEAPAVVHVPVIRGRKDKFGVAMGTGRRKTAVARVRLKDGKGDIKINGRELSEFFPTEANRHFVLAPLKATGTEGKVDLWVRVNGGGPTGQAGAIMLGVARALLVLDASHHANLSDRGYLTRDGRMVERKKYGFKKARRSFQFSKR